MEFLFTEHDGTIVYVCDISDGRIVLECGDGRNKGFNTICQREDIDKLIETLQKIKEEYNIVGEFIVDNCNFRIMRTKSGYVLQHQSEITKLWFNSDIDQRIIGSIIKCVNNES